MENKKKELYTWIFACLLGVATLAGVGFAVLSQTLTINQSTVNIPGWDVHFKNIANISTISGAQISEPNKPVIAANKTIINPFDVTLQYPGSTFSFEFDIENTGGRNAILDSLISPTLTATGGDGTAQGVVASLITSGDIYYTMTYSDGGSISATNLVSSGSTRTVKLTIGWKAASPVSQFPLSPVTVTMSEIKFNYNQVPT